MLGPACESPGEEAVKFTFLADDLEQDIRRKSSFALANKIWDLEDQKDARQRIIQTNS